MSFPGAPLTGDSRWTQFYCVARRRLTTVGDCLEDFLDTNALRRRRSRCYRCAQGREVREGWSSDRLTADWPTPSEPPLRVERRAGDAKARTAP